METRGQGNAAGGLGCDPHGGRADEHVARLARRRTHPHSSARNKKPLITSLPIHHFDFYRALADHY